MNQFLPLQKYKLPLSPLQSYIWLPPHGIEKELRKHEIPSCFFDLVISPGEQVSDCSMEAFAECVLTFNKNKTTESE